MSRLDETNWVSLVAGLRQCDPDAYAEFYRLLHTYRTKDYILRRVGVQDYEDVFHTCFLCVIRAIQRKGPDRPKHPQTLMLFALGVARFSVSEHLRNASKRIARYYPLEKASDRSAESTENSVIDRDIVARALSGLRPMDNELLTRHYFHDESQEEVCAAMGVTQARRTELKYRAQVKFAKRYTALMGTDKVAA